MLDFTESEPEPGEYLDRYRYHMAFDDDERPEDTPVFDQGHDQKRPDFSTPLQSID